MFLKDILIVKPAWSEWSITCDNWRCWVKINLDCLRSEMWAIETDGLRERSTKIS